VQDLQQDLRAVRVDRFGDRAQLGGVRGVHQRRRVLVDAAVEVRREAAGDDQRDAALRAFGVERDLPLDRAVEQLEPRVHRAHDRAVAQGVGADLQR
jgi:hypothetical protein